MIGPVSIKYQAVPRTDTPIPTSGNRTDGTDGPSDRPALGSRPWAIMIKGRLLRTIPFRTSLIRDGRYNTQERSKITTSKCQDDSDSESQKWCIIPIKGRSLCAPRFPKLRPIGAEPPAERTSCNNQTIENRANEPNFPTREIARTNPIRARVGVRDVDHKISASRAGTIRLAVESRERTQFPDENRANEPNFFGQRSNDRV
jgi:hypothetical protein